MSCRWGIDVVEAVGRGGAAGVKVRCRGGGGVVEAVGRGGAAGTEVRCGGGVDVVEGGGRGVGMVERGGRSATAVAEVRWWSGTCRQIQGRRFGYVAAWVRCGGGASTYKLG